MFNYILILLINDVTVDCIYWVFIHLYWYHYIEHVRLWRETITSLSFTKNIASDRGIMQMSY